MEWKSEVFRLSQNCGVEESEVRGFQAESEMSSWSQGFLGRVRFVELKFEVLARVRVV